MMDSVTHKARLVFAIIPLVAVIDQLSKAWVLATLKPGGSATGDRGLVSLPFGV